MDAALFIIGRVKYSGADHGAETYTSWFIHYLVSFSMILDYYLKIVGKGTFNLLDM